MTSVDTAVLSTYKQTELGDVPAAWEVKALRDFAHIETGSTPPTADPKNYGDEHFFVSPGDMGVAKWIARTEKRLSAKGFAASRRFPQGSVLFVCIGSTIGKCGVASTELTSNQQINAVLPGCNFSSDFLYYALLAATPRVRALAGEQAVPMVNKSGFEETKVALPPLEEQRAIAEALSDTDALIEGLDRLIAKKCDLKQAAMQQLLTGQTRLPGFTGKWKVMSLGDLFGFSGGYAASRDDLSSEGHRYLHYGDIHGSSKTSIDTTLDAQDIPRLDVSLKQVSPASLLHHGDVVFVDASEDDEGTTKHVVVSNQEGHPFIAGLHTIVAKPRTADLTHEYRHYCFQTEAVRKQFLFYAVGTKVSGISKTNIAKVFLPIPSTNEQVEIASMLTDMESELAALQSRRDKTRALKQAMMQELLTGRIRLI